MLGYSYPKRGSNKRVTVSVSGSPLIDGIWSTDPLPEEKDLLNDSQSRL